MKSSDLIGLRLITYFDFGRCSYIFLSTSCMKMFLISFDVQGSKAELEKHLKSKMYEHLEMSALHASQLDARNLELTKKLQKETRKAEQQEAIIYDQGIFRVTFHSG